MTVTSPTSEPSDKMAPIRNVATIAPTSANGSVRNTSMASRPEPKSASRIRKIAAIAPVAAAQISSTMPDAPHVRQGPRHSPQRKGQRRDPPLDITGHCAKVAPSDARRHVDSARAVFARDLIRCRCDLDARHAVEGHQSSIRHADLQGAKGVQIAPGFRCTLDNHIEETLIFVELAGFAARDEGRGGAH